MRFLLLVWLIPLLFLPFVFLGAHILGCELHIAVEGSREKQTRIERQGPFYGYCNFTAVVLGWIT